MAFAIIVEIPGGTREQYDRVNEAMGLKDAAAAPAGQVIHFAGPAEGSWIG